MTALILQALLPCRLACSAFLLFLSPLAPLVSSVAPARPDAPDSQRTAFGDSPAGLPGDAPDFCLPYVVMEGDTLDLIAMTYSVSREALVSVNRLPPGAPVHPGQRILIPPP